jgi:serine/threonine protein kinase
VENSQGVASSRTERSSRRKARDMKSEEWKQIDELFQQALNLAPAERAAFLNRTCDGKEHLRQQVESLLANYEQSDSFLEHPPGEIAAELLTSERSRFQEGQFIGQYQVIQYLGAGGMGEVYLARDPRLNRRVAIKVLPHPFISDSNRVRRFEQEAYAASALNHPNIVTIHEVGQVDDAHFIVAEYVEGETLGRRLKRSGPMSVGEALDVALQVANALEAAHTAGIIHRDIKPENIMLRPEGLVKVLDFGLAKLIGAPAPTFDAGFPTANLSQTATGMLSGTVQYMSPEQAQGQEVDARGDIWSLGVVLYEMVTGHPPFTGPTMSEVRAAILKDNPLPLAEFTSSVPWELERIERKAFAKSLEERYASATEMRLDLKKLDEELKLRAKLGLAEFTSSVPWELERIERKAFAKSLEERYASAREMHLHLKKFDEELKLQAKLGARSPAIPTKRERETTRTTAARLAPLRTAPNWPLFILGVIGILLTSYLTWTHLTGDLVKGCKVGSSCDIVLSSEWSTLMGIPTSALGLLAYASLAAIVFIKRADCTGGPPGVSPSSACFIPCI